MQKFEPDQLVLIRESEQANWDLARYSYCSVEQGQGQDHIHHIQGLRWFRDDEIIPYSGNEHLLGTTDSPTPKWEPTPFGRRLRAWRLEHGRTFRELCAETGIKPSVLSGIEDGRRMPTEEERAQLEELMR